MDSKSLSYHDEIKKKNILKLRELLKKLPPFAKEYFLGKDDLISSRTKIAYAYDLIVFFEYLHDSEDSRFSDRNITEYPKKDIHFAFQPKKVKAQGQTVQFSMEAIGH